MNAGDQADLQDSISLQDGKEPSIKLGTMRRLTVEKAVQAWSFPQAPTPHTIASLHPSVFEQIADEVRLGSPLADQNKPEDENDSESK